MYLGQDKSRSAQSRERSAVSWENLPVYTSRLHLEPAPTLQRDAPVDSNGPQNASIWSALTGWLSGKDIISPQSMFGSARRARTIPTEHTDRFQKTKRRVGEAALAILGPATDITHELLKIGADALQFAPIPALDVAAKALLSIWDAVELLEVNRVACLRLTERCADMLLSVREEIHLGGARLAEDMKEPIIKLEIAFMEIHCFMKMQLYRPFLHRYLKRDDIQRNILHCDMLLNDALGMFNIRIQIRILQLLRASEARSIQRSHHSETKRQPNSVEPRLLLTIRHNVNTANQKDPIVVQRLLGDCRTSQNLRDLAEDVADLRRLMHSALQKKDDVAIVDVLQISRDEMPEAIRTLQRALKGEAFGPQATSVLEAAGRSRDADMDGKSLDREFMQSGIDALTRLSQGCDIAMPEWTITRFEVELQEKIGIGFFSDVFKGRWRDRTVAIKVLAETTPRKLFVHEASVWKKLNHPNVLELLGASSATSDPPWFFVSAYYRNGNLVDYIRGLGSIAQLDVLKLLRDIARGMTYLHHKDVLHGDLKASNILVSDALSCVVSDFGQSEMRSEVFRLTGKPTPRGTLRWQSPELMKGRIAGLTREVDVYAFGISCAEIFNLGALPWPHFDDDTVRRLVCDEKKRPSLPAIPVLQGSLLNIIQSAWSESPALRPSFRKILQKLDYLRSHPTLNLPTVHTRDSGRSTSKLPQTVIDVRSHGVVTIHGGAAPVITVQVSRHPSNTAEPHRDVRQIAPGTTTGEPDRGARTLDPQPPQIPRHPTLAGNPPPFVPALPTPIPALDMPTSLEPLAGHAAISWDGRWRMSEPWSTSGDHVSSTRIYAHGDTLGDERGHGREGHRNRNGLTPEIIALWATSVFESAPTAPDVHSYGPDPGTRNYAGFLDSGLVQEPDVVVEPPSSSMQTPIDLRSSNANIPREDDPGRRSDLPSTQYSSAPIPNRPGPSMQEPFKRKRRGYWNRRGDYLTLDGYIVRAPYGRTYPVELDWYPEGDCHFRNHHGQEAKDPRYQELAGGSARYDEYIQYLPV